MCEKNVVRSKCVAWNLKAAYSSNGPHLGSTAVSTTEMSAAKQTSLGRFKKRKEVIVQQVL